MTRLFRYLTSVAVATILVASLSLGVASAQVGAICGDRVQNTLDAMGAVKRGDGDSVLSPGSRSQLYIADDGMWAYVDTNMNCIMVLGLEWEEFDLPIPTDVEPVEGSIENRMCIDGSTRPAQVVLANDYGLFPTAKGSVPSAGGLLAVTFAIGNDGRYALLFAADEAGMKPCVVEFGVGWIWYDVEGGHAA
jgi:hypothetical protein